MKIETIDISKLIPADYNPRMDLKPDDPEYEKLKKSLHEFGYVEPLVWNKHTGHLVGGHQRLKILMGEGLTEVEFPLLIWISQRKKPLTMHLHLYLILLILLFVLNFLNVSKCISLSLSCLPSHHPMLLL